MSNGLFVAGRVQAGIFMVGPEAAAALLERNTHNRPLARVRVQGLARAMLVGEWIDNGDTIAFDTDDQMVDGQHRLEAIVLSGVTLPLRIVTGLSKKAFYTKDTGKPRGYKDVLSIKSEKSASVLASVVRLMYFYETNGCTNLNEAISTQQLETALERHPGMRDSVAAINGMHRARSLMTPSIGSFCHYTFGEVSRAEKTDAAEIFFGQIMGSIAAIVGDPAFALTERLTSAAISKARMEKQERLALCIKAWNAHRAGKKVHVLRWGYVSSAAAHERFPSIDGWPY